MNQIKSSQRKFGIVFLIVLWIMTAWLVYPLVVLDSVDMENAKEYLYRSVFGITIMLILFGKTVFDIFFPQMVTRKTPVFNTIFLALYSLIIAGGIIFMVSRMIVLYLKSRESGILF